jgi:hypothetical protein
VRIAALHGFNELVDDMGGRRAVRIPHAEIDDVLAAPAGLHLEFSRDAENVRREALDARELRLGVRSHGRLP